ncbi:TIGR02452 family protein [Streptomyces sp. NPDC093252]|uniref:TIGR02452 family protein n=1 Tax=Streptomyces sp. NPDC093252 TaxID=3154980 RepID=UPI00342F4702
MSARLRALAKETERIVATGGYRTATGRDHDLTALIARATDGTKLYGPDPVTVPAALAAPTTTAVEVTAESSLRAARRLGDGTAVLNFASARNPGGGYLNGAQAQEEALCRASALYACLLRAPEYYDHHRTHRDPFYTDRVIHSPGVPVFRDDRGALLDTPFTAGFLTSPAPNTGVIRRTAPDRAAGIPEALRSRAERVLQVAAAHGYRRVVLGAWGCGVFQNDPATVAGTFRTLLRDGPFRDRFEAVTFAILDRAKDRATLRAFEETFA